jgi:putative cardiolipin synthase
MKTVFITLALAAAVIATGIMVLRLILPLPDIAGRPSSTGLPADPSTRLGAALDAETRARPGKTGIAPLSDGNDALGSRLALAALAERSIDAQYYIWHDDVSGNLLLKALYDAAKRGVRVRLLLDDNGVPGLDSTIAALNALDNFEIRLFNPSTVRNPKFLGYAFDFFRMNRRMHNKSFIVDGAVAIIGGRNIGDEYFKVGNEQFFLDLDVVGFGAIVPETVSAFDLYWNSASVFGAESIISGAGDLDAFLRRAAQAASDPAATVLKTALTSSAQRLAEEGAVIEWADVRLVVDDPAKGLGMARRDQLMITRLGDILGDVKNSLELVSAYFIPGRQGTEFFAGLARSGVQIRVLTNAINTTDVLMVHAGYTKYRRELLEAGVELFELKLREGQPGSEELNPIGLSGASLHAKTFAVDQSRVFIGSFNFDPRSATLNCEMGFLIDSPTLASRATEAFDRSIPLASYRPALTPENRMVWRETKPDGQIDIHQQEPGASWIQQVAIVVIGLLPIEWML